MFPEFLYYRSKQSKKCYSRVPPGQLDVVRLARGRADCWLKALDSSQKKPKNLIFADWSLSTWTPQELRERRVLLDKLMNEGFELMLWQDGKLVPLETLDLLAPKYIHCHNHYKEYEDDITPAYPDDIYAVATKEGLTPQNSLILDDYQFQILLEKRHSKEQLDKKLSCTKHDKAKITRILEATGELASYLGNTEKEKRENNILVLGDPVSAEELKSRCLHYPKLTDLLMDGISECCEITSLPEDLSFSGCLENLHALTFICVEVTPTSDNFLSCLLKSAPHLVELRYMDDSTSKNYFFELMEHLQYAQLDFNSYNIKSLNAFLEKTPNLKWLDIGLTASSNLKDGTVDNISVPENSLLEGLLVDSRTLNPDNLFRLIQGFQKLKTLRISGTIAPEFLLKYKQTTFPNITTLEFSAQGRSPSTLEAFLQMFPNARYVTIKDVSPRQKSMLYEKFSHIPYLMTPSLKINHRSNASASEISTSVDVDTKTDPKKSFNIKKVFFSPLGQADPHPAHYRGTLSSSVNLIQGPPIRFDLRKHPYQPHVCVEEPLRLIHDVYSLIKEGQYYGKTSLPLTQDWQPLPSLSTTDKITHYHVEPESANIELSYSDVDNLYYIRSTTPLTQEVTFDFLISQECTPAPSVEIRDLINKYRAFTPGELELPTPLTPENFLDAISEQKVGACRHRAVAFFLEIQKVCPARIVSNNCHMFVEIMQDGHWITCDLGGYPAQLNLDNSNAPKQAPRPLHETSTISYDTTKKQHYAKIFETWRQNTVEDTSELAYLQTLVRHSAKKQLITCKNESIAALVLALEHEAKSTSRPVIYLHSPEDIVCSAPYIERIGERGVLRKPTEKGSGPLYALLERYRHESPLIIVNYANFEADDIVRLNGLLDNDAHADGAPLPPRAKLIGIIDPEAPSSYQGADFYSRFDRRVPWPFETSPKTASLLHPLPADAPQDDAYVIDLFHSSDWRERLLGRWVLHQNQLLFEEGELTQALRQDKPIILQNPPYNDTFRLFWEQAHLRGYVDNEGERISFPPSFKLYEREGYSWSFEQIRFTEIVSSTAKPLNSFSLNAFLSDYRLLDGHQYTKTNGSLANAGDNIDVYVTHTLSEDEWDIFLKTCQQYPDLRITLSCAPNVKLPASWGKMVFASEIIPTPAHHTQLIHTNDPDAVIAELTSSKEWIIIDVSELSIQDLWIRLDAHMLDLSYVFSEQEKALFTALKNNKSVILTGTFSPELQQGLAPLLLNRLHQTEASGDLVLISDTPLHYVPMHTIPIDLEKKKYLLMQQGFSDELISKIPADEFRTRKFVELCTYLKYVERHPGASVTEAWEGLARISKKTTLADFNPSTSVRDAELFDENRCELVDRVLDREPYVFLAGLTGVGKSSFVENHYKSTEKRALYQGEKLETLRAWASHPDDHKRKILFLDEANLSATHWSLFEGLFHIPPSVIIDGQYYPLTPDHKVIFAGNPLSYGDERETPRLFQRHANTVIFEPLSTAFIYERVFKPVFQDSSLNEQQIAQLAHICFQLYLYLTDLSRTEVLISPREMQMLALFIYNYAAQHPASDFIDIQQAAQAYVYQLGKTLIPEEHKKQFERECSTSPQRNLGFEARVTQKYSHFIFTPSRHPMLACLDDYLNLRSYRQHQPDLNPAQKYGGLGGLIIEGAPGIGKSELVLHWLISRGFKQGNLYTPSDKENTFYRIPVSMELEAKKACLLKAFHEGAVVIIDEINASSMMEQFLNALLMGKDPDGNPPQKPGFMLIGTQNPASMGGRLIASTALKRRLQTTVLEPYPQEEIEDILRYKGVPESEIKPMTEAFIEKSLEAEARHLTPAPVFRDLMKTAEQVIEAHHRMIHQETMQSTLASLKTAQFKTALRETLEEPIADVKRSSP